MSRTQFVQIAGPSTRTKSTAMSAGKSDATGLPAQLLPMFDCKMKKTLGRVAFAGRAQVW